MYHLIRKECSWCKKLSRGSNRLQICCVTFQHGSLLSQSQKRGSRWEGGRDRDCREGKMGASKSESMRQESNVGSSCTLSRNGSGAFGVKRLGGQPVEAIYSFLSYGGLWKTLQGIGRRQLQQQRRTSIASTAERDDGRKPWHNEQRWKDQRTSMLTFRATDWSYQICKKTEHQVFPVALFWHQNCKRFLILFFQNPGSLNQCWSFHCFGCLVFCQPWDVSLSQLMV